MTSIPASHPASSSSNPRRRGGTRTTNSSRTSTTSPAADEDDGGTATTRRSGRGPSSSSRMKSKQEKVIRQLTAQDQYEKIQRQQYEQTQTKVLSSLIYTYLRILAVMMILFVGIGMYLYLPHIRHSIWMNKIRTYMLVLRGGYDNSNSNYRNNGTMYQSNDTTNDPIEFIVPERNLLLLYPEELLVKQNLPRFYGTYSIATKDNVLQQQAVQQMVSIRRIVTDPGSIYIGRQTILLHPWEHDDFQSQLPSSTRKDQVCGDGFASQYERQQQQISKTNVPPSFRDILLSFCLLVIGTHDGYIPFHIQIESIVSRGIQGVAFQYYNQSRIYPHLIILPILSTRERLERQQQEKQQTASSSSNNPQQSFTKRQPSTKLPILGLQWLRDYEHNDITQKNAWVEWESFLYRVITSEMTTANGSNNNNNEISGNRWVILQAVCTGPSDRADWDSKYQRIATTCHQSSLANDLQLLFPKLDEVEEHCCSFYDNNIQAHSSRPSIHDEE